MRYPAKLYAKAFSAALGRAAEGRKEVLSYRFAALLRKNGDLERAYKIFTEIKKEMAKSAGGSFVEIEYARMPDARQAELLEAGFGGNDIVSSRVNGSLVAGARITVDGERELDYSFARRIRKLFG